MSPRDRVKLAPHKARKGSLAVITFLAAFLPGAVFGAGPLFTASAPIAAGGRPIGVATADFNGDGKSDFAVVNAHDNNVTVMLGNGAGGFTAAAGSPFAVGSFPNSVIAKDFNKDGKMDLVTINAVSNNITVLLGNGAGGFSAAPGSPFATGSNPTFGAIGDFNGDTILDLAITNQISNNVTVLLGNGAGGFAQGVGSPYAVGSDPQGIVALDINKDGKMDLAVASEVSSLITVLLGTGNGSFTAGVAQEGASHASIAFADVFALATGDFLNRGITDIVSTSFNNNQVNFLKGDGAGAVTYNGQFTTTTGGFSEPINIISGDFDGDGNLDVAVICQFTSQVAVLLGNGAGSFTSVGGGFFATGNNPWGLASADFNGDGKLDLVVTNQNDNTVTVFINSFVAPVIPPVIPPVVPPVVPVIAPSPVAAPQTISFTLTDHLGSDLPFPVQATASSGLPVSLSITGGPATISGNTITLLGLGTVFVTAVQGGNSIYAPALLSQSFNITLGSSSIKSVVNGASFVSGVVPPEYYATLFGSNLVSGSTVGDANSSQSLEGISITILDSLKKSFTPNLSLMSFSQINFVVPAGVAAGPATLTVTSKTGKPVSTPITIGAVAPGLFSCDGTGTGGAQGQAVVTGPDGLQTQVPISYCTIFGSHFPVVPLVKGTQVTASVYGTGIRGRSSLDGVSMTIGGTPVTITYAGPHSAPALDRVDFAIPASLAGAGIVDMKLTVDGVTANTLQINLQ